MIISLVLIYKLAPRFGLPVAWPALILCGLLTLLICVLVVWTTPFLTRSIYWKLGVLIAAAAAMVTGVNTILVRRQQSRSADRQKTPAKKDQKKKSEETAPAAAENPPSPAPAASPVPKRPAAEGLAAEPEQSAPAAINGAAAASPKAKAPADNGSAAAQAPAEKKPVAAKAAAMQKAFGEEPTAAAPVLRAAAEEKPAVTSAPAMPKAAEEKPEHSAAGEILAAISDEATPKAEKAPTVPVPPAPSAPARPRRAELETLTTEAQRRTLEAMKAALRKESTAAGQEEHTEPVGTTPRPEDDASRIAMQMLKGLDEEKPVRQTAASSRTASTILSAALGTTAAEMPKPARKPAAAPVRTPAAEDVSRDRSRSPFLADEMRPHANRQGDRLKAMRAGQPPKRTTNNSAMVLELAAQQLATDASGAAHKSKGLKVEPLKLPKQPRIDLKKELSRLHTLDDFLDYAYNAQQKSDATRAIAADETALQRFPNDNYVPFLIIDLGNLYKDETRYEDCISIYQEALKLPIINENNAVRQEFQQNLSYMQLVYHILIQHKMPNMPFRQIPEDVLAEIERAVPRGRAGKRHTGK